MCFLVEIISQLGLFDPIKYFNGGSEIQLLPDNQTGLEGTGFETKRYYLFGHFSMIIKMAPRDSAGTVTAFYESISCA